MWYYYVVLVLLLAFIGHSECTNPAIEEEQLRARSFLQYLNERAQERATKLNIAEWAYASNITDANLQNLLAVKAQAAKDEKQDWQETITFSWQYYKDYDLQRQFKKYSVLGTSALPEDKLAKLEKIKSDMESTYATAKICSFKNSSNCDLSLEPEITELLKQSEDPEELKHLWIEWRNAVGPKVKTMYKEYVDLSNAAAKLNNFTDNSAYWLYNYEAPDFKEQVQALWEQVKPLYLQIHGYVRHHLRKKYGEDVVAEKGPIPAHLLGNMWAQTWEDVLEFTVPYPGKNSVDVTEELVKQNYTPVKIFKKAEEFFVSLNLTAMPELFWKNSILEKPQDRELVCHASAWDFADGKDFRIKQCTRIDGEDFATAHHEMGHIEYYLQYRHQPYIYREGANSGFHEAVGDVIALSVQTPKHLKKVGLLQSENEDPETVLNNLYKVGLDKIVFLPFGYLMDLWRWDVFSGKTKIDEYNCRWWQLRNAYQGIEPPINRTEEDFDPAAKYHIVADVPYIRYFVSFIIQFQFHRALCEKAGEYVPNDPTKPLHNCDIYQSTAAGNALGNMLQLGASRPWPDAMEVLTGQRNMDAGGLLEYFRPLQNWLEDYNKKNGVFVGWESPSKVCTNAKEKEPE